MENGSVQKGQNLLEDFVWPIDTGRLMGDTGRLMGDPNYFPVNQYLKSVVREIRSYDLWESGAGDCPVDPVTEAAASSDPIRLRRD